MSKLNDKDAAQSFPLEIKLVPEEEWEWELIKKWVDNAPLLDIEGRHCFNCKFISPGDFNEGDCSHSDSPLFFDLIAEAMPPNEESIWTWVGGQCPYYRPIYLNCGNCGVLIETPMQLVDEYVICQYGANPYCSGECRETLEIKAEQDKLREQEYEEEYQAAYEEYLERLEQPEVNFYEEDIAFDVERERRLFGI